MVCTVKVCNLRLLVWGTCAVRGSAGRGWSHLLGWHLATGGSPRAVERQNDSVINVKSAH